MAAPDSTDYRRGQLAYEGYYAASGGRSLVSGYQLPAWDELSTVIKDAWIAAALAVAEDVLADRAGDTDG